MAAVHISRPEYEDAVKNIKGLEAAHTKNMPKGKVQQIWNLASKSNRDDQIFTEEDFRRLDFNAANKICKISQRDFYQITSTITDKQQVKPF